VTHHAHTELSKDELEAQTGEELPEREAMSIVDLGEGPWTAEPVPVDSAGVDQADPVPPDDEVYPVDRPPHEPRPPAV
jgi:hypothetical protein